MSSNVLRTFIALELGDDLRTALGELQARAKRAGHMPPKDLTESIDTNIGATARLISYIEPLLGKDSKAVFFDNPRAGEKFFSAYGSTKGAQIAMAKSWQSETEKTGPSVRILTPAAMPTATRGRFYPGEDRSKLASIHDEAARLLPQILG